MSVYPMVRCPRCGRERNIIAARDCPTCAERDAARMPSPEPPARRMSVEARFVGGPKDGWHEMLPESARVVKVDPIDLRPGVPLPDQTLSGESRVYVAVGEDVDGIRTFEYRGLEDRTGSAVE